MADYHRSDHTVNANQHRVACRGEWHDCTAGRRRAAKEDNANTVIFSSLLESDYLK
jgi:hypothetical protein